MATTDIIGPRFLKAPSRYDEKLKEQLKKMERNLDYFEPDALKFKPGSLEFGKLTQGAPYQQGFKSQEKEIKLGFKNLDEEMAAFSNEWPALVIASYLGKVIQVQQLLDNMLVDVNATGKGGLPALMVASYKGHVEVIKLLLEHDADVNIQADIIKSNVSALMIASRAGHVEVVDLLLEYGAQVDVETNRGITPLMVASFSNYIKIVSLLLKKGANPNVQEENGISALMYAALEKNHSVIEMLLKNGANIDLQNINGDNSLMLACYNGHQEVAKILLEKDAQVNLQQKAGRTALFYAVFAGQFKMVRNLLNYGAQVNLTDNVGTSALMIAAENGHYDIAEILLQHGVQVNMQDINGDFALAFAVSEGHCKVVKLLLDHKAQPNLQNFDGRFVLGSACYYGYYEIVELLLKHGANPNLQNFKGHYSLFLASCNRQLELVKLLLKYGAELNMQDFRGCSSLLMACSQGEIKIAKYLLDHGADPNIQGIGGGTPLSAAGRIGHIELVSLLLEHGASVQDEHVLVPASANGHYEVVKLLLEKGTPVNQPGTTALMVASDRGHCNIVELLLENGASPNLRDANGRSALMGPASEEIVKILLKWGAKLDMQDLSGATALHLAAYFGHRAIVKLLLDHGAQPNISDHRGNSALHGTADSHCASLLLSRGAQPCQLNHNLFSTFTFAMNTKNYELVKILLRSTQVEKEELWHALDMANHLQNNHITALLYQKCLQVMKRNEALVVDLDFPGVTYWDLTIKRKISSRGAIIRSHSGGISLSIPEQALSPTEEDVDLLIRPCFNIPFKLPPGYEPASPAYLIQPSRMVKIQRDVTLKIHHYTSLKSREDCEEMAFLTASPEPASQGLQSVYLFKETKFSKGIFKPNNQVGEITVQHFCFQMIARKRTSSSKGGESLYSIRLYRGLSTHDVSAIFCMCLYHPMYLTHCDRMIADQYDAVPYKGGTMSGRDPVQMLGNEITLSVRNSSGWNVVFDKTPTTISKRDIHGPMKIGINKLNKLTAYPPRFSIFAHPSATHNSLTDPSSPQLVVQGLDIEDCCFEIITPYNQRSSSLSSTLSSQSRKSESDDAKLESCSAMKNQKNYLTSKDLCQVLTELQPVNTEWKYLGMELGIDYHVLQEIEKKYPNNTKECMAETVNEWLKTGSSTLSWETLCKALHSKIVANPVLAETIEKKYC